MELVIIARFYAREGFDDAIADAIAKIAPPSRGEPGCKYYGGYRSTLDPRRFFLVSRWDDEASFRNHTKAPHLLKFLERVEPLVDHPLDISHTVQIA